MGREGCHWLVSGGRYRLTRRRRCNVSCGCGWRGQLQVNDSSGALTAFASDVADYDRDNDSGSDDEEKDSSD